MIYPTFNSQPDIQYEDNDIIVCVKPAGIPTQTSRIGTPDMVSLLKNYLYRSQPQKEPYLAVIHRLDQPVEGLLVFAKTPYAAKELNRQLTASGFGKYYRAVLTGSPANPEGTLENYMVKDGRSNTSRLCSPNTPNSKPARLRYKVLQTCAADNGTVLSLTEIHLDTGRHHQIRVQMAGIGCPIAGDRKYGAPKTGCTDLQLYACRLAFAHPRTKKPLEFTHTPDIPFISQYAPVIS